MRFNRIWQRVLRIGFSGNRNQPKNLSLRQAVEEDFSTTSKIRGFLIHPPTLLECHVKK